MALPFTKLVIFQKELCGSLLNKCVQNFSIKTSNVHTCPQALFRLSSPHCIIHQKLTPAVAFDLQALTHRSHHFFVNRKKLSSVSSSWFQRRRKSKNYDIVGLGEVSETRLVLEHIKKPEYAVSGVIEENDSDIEIKTEKQIKCMRESCALARTVLDEVGKYVKVGITTDELDNVVHLACISFGAYPSPLNYRGFPKSVCTSVNNVACHGVPDNRPLKDGDIVSIDVSVYHNGFHGDCAATYGVGTVDVRGRNLMNVALQCLNKGVGVCYPGQPFCQIGKTISEFAESHGFAIVPAFCGHGIGSYFHGQPNIYHIPNDDERVMKEGMIFTIEPVVSEGGPDILVLEDGWTAVTEDNSRCAQYEHTVLITKNGVEILTLPKEQNAS